LRKKAFLLRILCSMYYAGQCLRKWLR
jgi:hypothetical protein